MPNRRELLTTLGALAGAGIAKDAWAVKPLQRTGGPELRLSCAAYSFRDHLTGKREPKLTLEDFVDKCAEWGLPGTELTSYYFPKEVTNGYLDSLKARAKDRGLKISGTAVGNNFLLPPGEKRKQQLAHVRRWIEYAERMEAPTIRIFAGTPPKGTPTEQARQWCLECLADCCPYAKDHGVALGLENHGGFTASADALLAIVEAADLPALGINLDTGNFHTADPYDDLRRAAPYAVSVQVKVEVAPQGGQRQPTDFARVVKILREANYQGWVALEYEAKEPPLTAVPRHLQQLRAAVEAAA